MLKQHGINHNGSFVLEVYSTTPISGIASRIGDNAEITGSVISIPTGSAKHIAGGIHFTAGPHPFYLDFEKVKRVSDAEGVVLWENENKD